MRPASSAIGNRLVLRPARVGRVGSHTADAPYLVKARPGGGRIACPISMQCLCHQSTPDRWRHLHSVARRTRACAVLDTRLVDCPSASLVFAADVYQSDVAISLGHLRCPSEALPSCGTQPRWGTSFNLHSRRLFCTNDLATKGQAFAGLPSTTDCQRRSFCGF